MKCRNGALACLIVASALAAPEGQSRQIEWFSYGGDSGWQQVLAGR